MEKEKYEIRYGGTPNEKIVVIKSRNRALRFYDNVKYFALSHGIVWFVSLFEIYPYRDSIGISERLIKSETVNGDVMIL